MMGTSEVLTALSTAAAPAFIEHHRVWMKFSPLTLISRRFEGATCAESITDRGESQHHMNVCLTKLGHDRAHS